jgi:hypothetical protein
LPSTDTRKSFTDNIEMAPRFNSCLTHGAFETHRQQLLGLNGELHG